MVYSWHSCTHTALVSWTIWFTVTDLLTYLQRITFPLSKSMQSLKTISTQLFEPFPEVNSITLKYLMLYQAVEDLSPFWNLSCIDAFPFENCKHFYKDTVLIKRPSLKKETCLSEAVKRIHEQYSRNKISVKAIWCSKLQLNTHGARVVLAFWHETDSAEIHHFSRCAGAALATCFLEYVFHCVGRARLVPIASNNVLNYLKSSFFLGGANEIRSEKCKKDRTFLCETHVFAYDLFALTQLRTYRFVIFDRDENMYYFLQILLLFHLWCPRSSGDTIEFSFVPSLIWEDL